ncbi:MAG: M28 family peptidase [Gemmatimonadota bacterium]
MGCPPRAVMVARSPAIDPARLRAHVQALEGERHARCSPGALASAEAYVAGCLSRAGLEMERHTFRFRGREFSNVVGRQPGRDSTRPRILVGAHIDTVVGTPGADDDASGVAVLLEVARCLAGLEFEATLEWVAFNLEERQGWTYRVGSRHFVRASRRAGIRYGGCLILEMVGYTDASPGTQRVPLLLRGKAIPESGTFLSATGDRRSRRLLRRFRAAAARAAPDLGVVTVRVPLRGWPLLPTRWSDHASFWSARQPALLLTDTAFLRNPHYHGQSDRTETLDFEFMRQVAVVTMETVRELATPAGLATDPSEPRRRRSSGSTHD